MNVNKIFKGACLACLAVFLAFSMSLLLLSVLAEKSASGNCGTDGSEESVSWEIDSGTLRITGTGEMKDFDNSTSTPWYDKASTITSIVIEEGVKSIGNYAFCGLTSAEMEKIPSTVTRIGVDAFKDAKCETKGDGPRYVGNWLTGFGSSLASEIEVKDDTEGIADFASADANVTDIILPNSIKHIGENFLNGNNLKNVYIDGTFENSSKQQIKKLNGNVNVNFMVIANGELSIEGLNETSVYHVGERPTFNAKLKDDAAEENAPRCTIEEKWVSTDRTKEITAKNSEVFEEGVAYNYIIVVNPADKFSFDQNSMIVVNSVRLSTEGILTYRQNFEALISIDSVSLSESENFNISCNKAGTQPKFIEVSTGASYSIVYQLWEKLDDSSRVAKRVTSGTYTPNDSGVDKLESFENGVYKYTVCFKPNEGYYFNPKFTATLGGKAATVTFKEDGSVVLTLENLRANHSFPLAKTDKADPTCTTAGNKEYYECPNCKKTFADEDAKKALTDIQLSAKGHTFTKVKAVAPTCTKKGNIEYFECPECGTYFESKDNQPGEEIADKTSVELDMIPHTFDESVFAIDGENDGHYHKCKICGAHSETVVHTFDKKVEDKKYLKDGLTCGDVMSYYKSCECGESSKGTESEETFENEEGKKVEHEFGEDGVCTICKATNYKVSAVDGNTYTEIEDGSLVFRANGSLDKLSSVKVDGTVLTKDKDYTVKSGSTIVELKNDYLKTLSAGDHTLTLVYEDGECEAEFEVKDADLKISDDESEIDDSQNGSKGNIISDIIYKTGDNVGLISLISTMLTSGLASVWFAKKRRKNR